MSAFVKRYYKLWIVSICIMLLGHLIKFVNYYPTWDSMYGVVMGWGGMTSFGRWFSGIAEILLSTRYDLQWVVGVEATFFVSLTILLIIDLFEIKDIRYQLAAIWLFEMFPCFAATFMYGLWTPAYMLALFLAVIAVYMTYKSEKKYIRLFMIICMTLSLAIYQIYYLFAVALVVLIICKELLSEEYSFSSLKKIILQYIILFMSSMFAYVIVSVINKLMTNYTLASYQGFDSIGQFDIINSIKKFILYCGYFFYGKKTIYGVVNIIMVVITVVVVYQIVYRNSSLSVGRKVWLTLLFLSVFPITYAYFFVSPGVMYHRLMELGNYLFYFISILLICRYESFRMKRVSKIVLGLLFVLGFYHFLNNNVAYHQANMSYERAYFETAEIMAEIDRVNVNRYNKIMILGGLPTSDEEVIAIPTITGASTNNFLTDEMHITTFAKYYLNRDYERCSAEERESIVDRINLDELSVYPYGNYVTIIDDVIVVNLSAKVESDIE